MGTLLRVARESKPDVVLLDLYMPGVNGLVAGELLKRAMPQVKIVVVSVNDDPKTAVGALNGFGLRLEVLDGSGIPRLSVKLFAAANM